MYTVKFGSSFKLTSSVNEQTIPVKGVDHYSYEPSQSGYLTHDIALLELEYPVNIDNYTRPVCLGTDETLQTVLTQPNPECFVTGFGQTEKFFNGMFRCL